MPYINYKGKCCYCDKNMNALRKRNGRNVYFCSKYCVGKFGGYQVGKLQIRTEQHKINIGKANKIALKGRKETGVHKNNIRSGMLRASEKYGWKHWRLLGKTDKEYCNIHKWVYRKMGSPRKCELCKNISKKIYHWANISGEYNRDIKDWIRLCPSCHVQMDRKRKGSTTIIRNPKKD